MKNAGIVRNNNFSLNANIDSMYFQFMIFMIFRRKI